MSRDLILPRCRSSNIDFCIARQGCKRNAVEQCTL